jgi:hypothetical protein
MVMARGDYMIAEHVQLYSNSCTRAKTDSTVFDVKHEAIMWKRFKNKSR